MFDGKKKSVRLNLVVSWGRALFTSLPGHRGRQQAAAMPHTKAPTGLSQPARRFPGTRTRRCPAPFPRGSTIITVIPFICPVWPAFVPRSQVKWGANKAATKGRSYPVPGVPGESQIRWGGFQVVLARGTAVIVPIVPLFNFQATGEGNYLSLHLLQKIMRFVPPFF